MRIRLLQIASKVVEGLRTDPNGLYEYAIAFIRGSLFVAFYRAFRRRVTIKLPFFVFSKKVKISGPGTVFIDSGCSVFTNAFSRLTITTLSPQAYVSIGRNCDLGGVTIRCQHRVILGERVLAANCLVQDTLFATGELARLTVERVLPQLPTDVLVGKGVWLAGQTVLLGGTNIGDGSVLSLGSVAHSLVIPESNFATGNPVTRSFSIMGVDSYLKSA